MKFALAKTKQSLATAFVVLQCAAPLLGCMNVTSNDESVDADLFEIPAIQENDIKWNDIKWNDIKWNGWQINGPTFVGVSLAGGFSLQGGSLVMTRADHTILTGSALVGLPMRGVLSDNSTVYLQIARAIPTDDPEIYKYNVESWDGSRWSSLCGQDAAGAQIPAYALAGRWDESVGTSTGGDYIDDPSLFTFACAQGVLAKCVAAGYAPWKTVVECNEVRCQHISMRVMHQACTRMMRADYCGDGTPHTQAGTPINVWDHFDVQVRAENAPGNWHPEAEWGSEGAVCIRQARWPELADADIDAHCPGLRASATHGCFDSSSTFFTENGYNAPLDQRSLLRNEALSQ